MRRSISLTIAFLTTPTHALMATFESNDDRIHAIEDPFVRVPQPVRHVLLFQSMMPGIACVRWRCECHDLDLGSRRVVSVAVAVVRKEGDVSVRHKLLRLGKEVVSSSKEAAENKDRWCK